MSEAKSDLTHLLDLLQKEFMARSFEMHNRINGRTPEANRNQYLLRARIMEDFHEVLRRFKEQI